MARGTGYVIDPSLVNYERPAEDVFAPESGDNYVALRRTSMNGDTIDLDGVGYEVFASEDEALAVASSLNNGLDFDDNTYGVVLKSAV
jgi:hypothetical protein